MRRVGEAVQPASGGVKIDMAPLIDCVFLLLIFFVSTTVFVQTTGVEVQKPKAASVRDMDKNSIMIALTTDGRIVFGGRQIPLNSVRGLVSQLLREKDVPVMIMADSASLTGRLVDLIDECKLAGARQVSLAATRER